MGERRMAALPVTGEMARTQAARVEAAGYQVQFPPGRDPAMFKVIGLPGGPHVEVTAEEDGSAGCFYMGRTPADAAQVIGRLPGHPDHPDVEISTWEDIAVEWNYLPRTSGPPTPAGSRSCCLPTWPSSPGGRRTERTGEMIMACASVADRVQPGELMRLVAGGLASSGLEVRLPGPGHDRHLAIACPGPAQCALAVSDCGLVELDCWPPLSGQADPKQVADLATALLTGRAGDYPRQGTGYGRPDATLKGIVGLELAARGLDVELEVYEDKESFEAWSQ
jgi:hypothetical protein